LNEVGAFFCGKILWVPLFWVFSVLDQARLGLDVLPVMLRDVRAG
jgi:hypothetical protein